MNMFGSADPTRQKFVEPTKYDSVFWVETDRIQPNPYQPRREFDEDRLKALAESIRQYGVLQPLVVTRTEMEKAGGGLQAAYELIAGERRLRASKLIGLREVPVVIRAGEQSDKMKLELAIIENLQREDLNPLEEALAYRRLQDEFGLTQEQVAKRVGKSRSQVANTERLLALPASIQAALRNGKITVGHAKVIMSLESEAEMLKFFETVTREGLPVRLAEAKARQQNVRRYERRVARPNPEWREYERKLQQALGTRVKIRGTGKGGALEVVFFSGEELAEIVRKVTGQS